MNSISPQKLRYLLLQIRNSDDPMRDHEIGCFARGLGCDRQNIQVHDLISSMPTLEKYRSVDAVLIGGSGDYSVVTDNVWLEESLAAIRMLYEYDIPTFASCWGFQALSKALGGQVVHDLGRAEIGTLEIRLTEQGQSDPVFGVLQPIFMAQMGHEDIVDSIPEQAILLASTDRVANQAFTFADRMIYATQFHPELEFEDLLLRLEMYPKYVEKITGLKFEEFKKHCHPTPATGRLLQRFVSLLAKSL